VIVISIGCIRGGKLYSEHVYWDQASVLLQVGLLDSKLVPEDMKGRGVHQLPIVGREAARRILDGEDGKRMNELVPGWGTGVNQERSRQEKDGCDGEEEVGGEEEEVSDDENEASGVQIEAVGKAEPVGKVQKVRAGKMKEESGEEASADEIEEEVEEKK